MVFLNGFVISSAGVSPEKKVEQYFCHVPFHFSHFPLQYWSSGNHSNYELSEYLIIVHTEIVTIIEWLVITNEIFDMIQMSRYSA